MTEVDDALTTLGGKAFHLRRLAAAGLPVPAFVTIPADEYRAFVDDANLNAPLFDALTTLSPDAAAAAIADAFARATPRRRQRERLLELVTPLLDAPVAVRSSATAEDLPDLSFAGQLESFLGVRGPDAVLDAVVRCWASAWTPRAIAYRARNGVPHDGIAVAVIVQRLVDAEASGVLFTANPLTGRRDETVIDAVPGLGDALVQGRVTPDHYVVDTASGVVTQRTLVGEEPPLTPGQVRTLTDLGRRSAALFGVPQDLEWVRVGDDVQVVQSRPITSLFPLPSADPSAVWFSMGAFQGMLDPLTPLGSDLLRRLFAGGARAFGRVVDPATSPWLATAGERLWVRVDGLLRAEAGRRLVTAMMPMVDPAATRILRALADEPRFAPTRRTPTLAAGVGLASALARISPRVPATVRRPSSARDHLDGRVDKLLGDLERSLAPVARVSDPRLRVEGLVLAVEKFTRGGLSTLVPAFAPIMGPGILATRRLKQLAARTGLPDADALALHALRALPGNVTTAMDIALWETSRAIRSDPHAWGVLADTDPAVLARRYLAGHLPTVAQEAIGAFVAAYGARGVGEIDVGAPRWRDDPAPLLAILQSYVATDAPVRSPVEAHREGQRAAGRAVRTLVDSATAGDAREIRALVHRIRSTMGARETPKFCLIRGLGLLREALLREADALVAARVLSTRDDVFFLTLDELRHVHDAGDLAPRIAERRGVRARELRRRAVPRVIVGDGRTFYDGVVADPDSLSGAGVSPGVAEGPVRVVLRPGRDQVAPGEVLVCPATDPAWTPLFHHAAALVTEVGGLMTHGSVVAREYGIPAVVGVRDATTRLTTGQRVRIDGTSGTIEVL